MAEFAAALYERSGIEGERRRKIVQVLGAALDAVDPYRAVLRFLRREGDILWVKDRAYDLAQYKHVYVVGTGKAGAPMAQAVESVLDDRIVQGHVNVKYEHTAPTRVIHIHEAGHPIPDEAGVAGGRRIVAILEEAGEQDLVFCLISGGGSALMTSPEGAISLADMKMLTDGLLRAGATINEINAIRKHLDALKGGKLARLAQPAQVISLILSDVVGNPLDVIASGPTVPDTSTFSDAHDLLQRYGLWDTAPESIQAHIRQGLAGEISDTPQDGDAIFGRTQNVIVASNDIAALAAQQTAQDLGLSTLLLSTFVEGEAREVAKVLAALAKEVKASGRPIHAPACIILGGETTVSIRGKGKGGRNQEMALAAALSIQGMDDVHIVCLATDGNDGPTDATGALANGDTIARARAQGLDAWAHLDDNNAYPFFQALGDLLLTGPTNTNVNDLAFVFVW